MRERAPIEVRMSGQAPEPGPGPARQAASAAGGSLRDRVQEARRPFFVRWSSRRLALSIVLLLGFLFAAGLLLGALGQEGDGSQAYAAGPLRVDPLGDQHALVPAGGSSRLEFVVSNQDDATSVLVVTSVRERTDSSSWSFTAVPNPLKLGPGAVANVTVVVEAPQRPVPDPLRFAVHFDVSNSTTGLFAQVSVPYEADATGVQDIMGRWPNPLPAPLDNAYGAALLNLVAWTLVGVLAYFMLDPVVKVFTARTKTDLDDILVAKTRGPLFAMIVVWGVRDTLGVFVLSAAVQDVLDKVYLGIVVIVAGVVVYRVYKGVLINQWRRLSRRTESKLDDRLLPVFEKAGGVVLAVAILFIFISALGIDLTLFAAGGLLVSMVISFAAQDTLANFFAGMHILLAHPFKEGDDIILESGEVVQVTEVGLQITKLYHRKHHEMFMVPNSMLTKHRITNLLLPDQKYKVNINVGVAYGSPVDRVEQVLLEAARHHPRVIKGTHEFEPFVRFSGFGDSALVFDLWAWVDDVYARWGTASDLRKEIDRRFREEEIEIPFPQRTVWMWEMGPPKPKGKPPREPPAKAEPPSASASEMGAPPPTRTERQEEERKHEEHEEYAEERPEGPGKEGLQDR